MKQSGKVTFYAIAKLLLAGLGLMTLITAAVSAFVFGLFSVIVDGVESIGAFSMLALSWNAGLMFLLLIPMLVNVFLVLLGKDPLAWPARLHMKASTVALLAVAAAVLGGNFACRTDGSCLDTAASLANSAGFHPALVAGRDGAAFPETETHPYGMVCDRRQYANHAFADGVH